MNHEAHFILSHLQNLTRKELGSKSIRGYRGGYLPKQRREIEQGLRKGEILGEHIRAGDVSIVGSRQYRDFEEYLFSEDTWNQTKENTRLSVSLSFKDYITERTSSLNGRLHWLAGNSNKLDGVSLEKGKLSISRLV